MRLTAVLVVAFATGAAVMTIELMGIRLMAPWFGQSQVVWTNVIGVVLLALAAGQWLGGHWSELGRGRGPGVLMIASGAACAALPDVIAGVAASVFPSDLALAEAAGFVAWGSLLVSLIALGVPMLALGTVTPWLVRICRDSSRRPGGISGLILAAGTLGSLFGTFGATHLLLPLWGSSVTVRVSGVVLLLLGFVVSRWSRSGAGAWYLVLLFPVVMSMTRASNVGSAVLEERETRYQWARIVEDSEGRRLLKLNEGLDSFHSAYLPGSVLTRLYFDAFVLPVLLSPSNADGDRTVLIVGLGGGTMARVIDGLVEGVHLVGVEIDPDLIELGRDWLGLEDGMVDVRVMDGRVALRLDPFKYSAILLDAFSDQIYIPHHLCTREYFELVRSRLVPGGILAANVGGITRDDPVIAGVVRTLCSVFDQVEMARIPGTRNWMVLAWSGRAPNLTERQSALHGTPMEQALAWTVDGSHFAPVVMTDGPVLVDGDAAVEHLAHQAWRSP